MRSSPRPVSILAVALILIAGYVCAEDVVEETTVDDDGVVEECGDGPGLQPCRDAGGETWKHADDPDYIKVDSTQQLEQSSQQIRDESPKELEQTIEQIEDDEKN
jgi:hypothetical protein